MASFFLNLYSKLSSVILLTLKSEIDFIFYNDVALDLPIQLQCLVDKTLGCLENINLEIVGQSSPMKKIFLKILQNLESICAGVCFLINCRLKASNFIKKVSQHKCYPVNFSKCITKLMSTWRKVSLYPIYCSFIWCNYIRIINKKMLLIRLQTQIQIRYDF